MPIRARIDIPTTGVRTPADRIGRPSRFAVAIVLVARYIADRIGYCLQVVRKWSRKVSVICGVAGGGFNHRENRRDFGSELRAADVKPVLAVQGETDARAELRQD